MRRAPAFVWVLAPLALGVLYALLWPLLAPGPVLLTVVPEQAILTHRFRNRAMFDEAFFRGANDPVLPSEREAARRNLPGLPGIDPNRPFHLVFLPRGGQPNPTLLILPVADAALVRERFEDPSFFLERGFIRYAQHLGIRGEFAAVARDREVVQELGGGGITAPVLGEDHVLAVRVPEMVRFALSSPMDPLWGPILAALGFDPRAGTAVPQGVEVPVGRLQRVHDTWLTARMWSWIAKGRIRADLEPAPGPLADHLRALHEAPAASWNVEQSPVAPPEAQAWVRIPGPRARAVMAWALWGAGVPFPEGLASAASPLGLLDRSRPGDTAGLLVWSTAAPGSAHAWTLGVAAPSGSLPPLSSFHEAFGVTEEGVETPLPEGALPLTVADLGGSHRSPAAVVVRRHTRGLDLVFAGPGVREAWRGFETHLARDPAGSPPEAPGPEYKPVASFGLIELRARALFGTELASGGLLTALGGGDIEGAIFTDGKVLRLEAHVTRR